MFFKYLASYWWLILIALVLGGFFFLSQYARKLQKLSQDELTKEKPNTEIDVGSNVTLDSGIHGIIREIKDGTYMIEIAKNVIIEIEKYGVIFVR